MTTIDHGAIARQLGYSKDEMIAKFGNPGERNLGDIGNSLGLDNSTMTSIFGAPKNSSSSTDFSSISVSDLVSGADNDAIASALGYSKEEMEAKFGKPGETDPKDIAAELGLSDEETTNIFGNYTTTEEDDALVTTETEEAEETEDTTSNSEKTKDDKYQKVADAVGIDRKTVSAIMKYVASGNVSGAPEKVVPAVAYALGISEYAVSKVLNYID